MINKEVLFKLPVIITKQNKDFVAYSPALDISTCGKTEKQVKSRFVELAHIFLEELFEAQTAHDVLSELGWTKVEKKWTPPQVVSSDYVGLNIPVVA